MAAVELSAGNGIAFLVSAGIVAEIIAKACSSPQTMHINARARAATLMLWVNVGAAEAVLFIAVAAWIDKKHRAAIIAGGLLELILTYGEYIYARQAGLASGQPGTESY
jgi:preprotein translocase subunit SecY